ncbi:apolipoprotein N-acyltransferase [Sandaracinus amylolyticus]|uniref:apolipoprotein N-acyltransferase n=1 Tax=Sandaracinus amylolyticus TaxID=927083 RepID=UPI001F00EE1B|nr:apolipoprotein N-acyltransferase [Sandaracinus amylolyticus]UJR81806.1 Apolipoprotein N-acyltransferase [Sandaracinus amylolyticus]
MKRALRAVLLGGAGGACIAVAGSPLELVALAFLGPALLLLAIDDGETSPRIALLAGASCGFVCNAITTSWIVPLLEEYAAFPTIAGVAVGALMWIGQALPIAVGAWLAAPLMTRGIAGWIALPITLTIAGSIAPMLFPWRLGVSQMPGVTFVQLAELGGPPLIDLALALGSCAAMHALRRRDPRVAVIAALVIALPYAYGAWRIDAIRAQREAAPSLRIGVVQPNLGVREKHDPFLRDAHLRLHRDMTRELEARGVDLVLWPESSYPSYLPHDPNRDLRAIGRILSDGVRGPILFGALTEAPGRRYNSVIGLAREGHVTGIYDKVNLLAFGEYVPLWDFLPPLQRVVRRGFTHGLAEGTVPIAGAHVGVLNCYEDLLVEHARLTAALDPSFLANFTNDAWFGDTFAPHLHHMLARLRAVETRRDLVRAVNTGVSGLVLATGEDAGRTPPFERTSFIAEVRLLDGALTPWVRFGDLVTPALLGVYLAMAFARRRAPVATT